MFSEKQFSKIVIEQNIILKMFVNTHPEASANGTACFKNVNNCLNTNLGTSGGQSSNLYFNVVHFFNTSVN
jgi:hypothetical protein